MKRLAYLLTYPILWVISKLPYRAFYAVSDITFFLVYYIVGYRKKVVEKNLTLAFPEKSKEELHKIRKEFYHHFCDLFLEMTKSLSISKEEMKERFVLKNPEELKRIESLGKSYILMGGHYNSYEWASALKMQGLTFEYYGVYKKIKNPYFDKLIHQIRGRFGAKLLDKNDVLRQMVKEKRDKKMVCYGMVADQAPKGGKSKYWRPFFGHRVPVFIGSEVAAKKLDLSVVYLKIEKVKRGYYQAEIIPLADNPKEIEDFKITDKYFELLENQIKKEPKYYLWTHKRWKHLGKENKYLE